MGLKAPRDQRKDILAMMFLSYLIKSNLITLYNTLSVLFLRNLFVFNQDEDQSIRLGAT